ncbi:MAG: hypothetical protein JW895_00310 [Thermoleophilaceae bacterium]|nr:hypothetical protein [Thermoleophilaceae bacterium]
MRRDQRVLALLSLAASAAALLGAVLGHETLLAYAGPFLVLLLPLLAGRFVGEERIARAAARRRGPRPRPRAETAPVTWLRDAALVARGGRLIARSLAVRPPPPASA